jgi:hypothetical protein
MDEVVEALEKYQGLVPLVYDIETMSLDEARPEDMPYAVYLKREADKVIADLEESHKKEVGQLLMEIVGLKEERRWRKFPDEKPTEEMEGMDFIVSNGFFHREISEWRGYWNNDPFCGDRHCDEVKYWRPLPSDPKEGK